MSIIQEMLLVETQHAAAKEIEQTIAVINKIYGEWKKTTRRINAVDLITTSANKIAGINPETVERIHDAAKIKLCIILMRCMDIPPWRAISGKEKLYKKLYHLIQQLETFKPNTGSGGNLREIIMTRLSAAIAHQDEDGSVFVAYEPVIDKRYLDYLFASKKPAKTFRMMALSLPGDFESLVEILTINHEKAKAKMSKVDDERASEV